MIIQRLRLQAAARTLTMVLDAAGRAFALLHDEQIGMIGCFSMIS